MDDKNVALLKSDGDKLSITNPFQVICKDGFTGEINTEWNDPYIKVSYKNLSGTQEFYYSFNGLDQQS